MLSSDPALHPKEGLFFFGGGGVSSDQVHIQINKVIGVRVTDSLVKLLSVRETYKCYSTVGWGWGLLGGAGAALSGHLYANG